MRRGLITALSVGLIALGAANAARAAAPSLDAIPVIIISDLENNQGSVDNNLFVFSDTFVFADLATDADTLATDLDWSFDYDPGAAGNVGNIEINDVARLDVGGGGDPLAPGALAINTSATATFREVDLSPTAGSAPFPSPAAGTDGVDTGVGIFNDVVGDLVVTYYVSDGSDFDMADSMVFTVDTDLGATEPGDQAGAGGPPVLTFDPITPLTSAGGWAFTPGDGFVTEATTSGETGGLQINQPAATATTILTSYTGIWAHETLSEVNITGNQVYAARLDISANIAPTPVDGSKPRARLEPTTNPGGIDYQYVVNENNAISPFSPEGGNTYVAYWAKYGLSSDGQMTLALDHDSTGSESGTDRTVTFSSVEIGNGDFDAFTGSSTPIASGTFAAGEFTDWVYFNLDTPPGVGGVFGGLTFWEGGTLDTSGGLLTHVDANEPDGNSANGGAALLNIGELDGVTDRVEFIAGAFYWNQFEVSFADAAMDGDWPAVQLDVRAANPSMQASNTLRTDGDHADMTVASAANGLYDILWVAPDNGEPAAANNDDLIEGFSLFNVNAVATHGGSTTLNAARYWVIGTEDPNNP